MAADGRNEVSFQQLIDAGILQIGDGYRAKNSELGDGGPLFLRAGHVTDTHINFDGVDRFKSSLRIKVQPKMAQPGDTLVTTKGNSTGRTSYVDSSMPPFVYSPHISYWRSLDSDRLEPGFLRYWAKSHEFTTQLHGMMASTDMAPYLSLTDQRSLRITLPDIAVQRGVAHILGSLDDKIELNRRMNRKRAPEPYPRHGFGAGVVRPGGWHGKRWWKAAV
jgi:type I restriction enzyme S subunit